MPLWPFNNVNISLLQNNHLCKLTNFQQYQNFISGRHLGEGIKISVGILLPAVLLSYFDRLDIGFVISLAASAVAITDNPGPVRHRRNGMLICVGVLTIFSFAITLISKSNLLLLLVLPVSAFLLSMLNIYGLRASLIGLAALIIGILSLNTIYTTSDIFYPFYIFIGGLWYVVFSLLVYSIRPYKLIQQVLGDYVIEIGNYLQGRSEFYDSNPDYEDIYRNLFLLQSNVEKQQTLLSEMLFKTRTVIKESTNTSRQLLKIYLDVTDIFESSMSAFHDYRVLHENFDQSGILEMVKSQLVYLSGELKRIGIAIKSGSASLPDDNNNFLQGFENSFNSYRDKHLTGNNLESFISFGRVRDNIINLTQSISQLHYYTNNKTRFRKNRRVKEYEHITTSGQDVRMEMFFSNLNLNSSTFRHSLRIAIALFIGLLFSFLLPLGHSHWLLLTIAVIIKPAYGLTRQRNRDRIIGTVAGLVIGALCLLISNDEKVLLGMLVIFMVAAYTNMRSNYLLSVIATTVYVVILFHILSPTEIGDVLVDRLIDTLIGSMIAFFVNRFLFTNPEHRSIRQEMTSSAQADLDYFIALKEIFIDNTTASKKRLNEVRNNSLVNLVSMADAFTRMLSEPRHQQIGVKYLHRFAVLQHILASNFSTLNYFHRNNFTDYRGLILEPVARDTVINFQNTIALLQEEDILQERVDKKVLERTSAEVEHLLQERREELAAGEFDTETRKKLIQVKSVTDQFNLIHNTSKELVKTVKLYLQELK